MNAGSSMWMGGMPRPPTAVVAGSSRGSSPPGAPDARGADDEPANAAERQVVLLVDDESSVLRLAARVLERGGYEVWSAEGPHQAIERYGEQIARVDMIVTDIVMPGMNGVQLYRRFWEQRPDIPVLFMSGYAPEDVAAEGLSFSTASFLPKPWTASALLSAVRSMSA